MEFKGRSNIKIINADCMEYLKDMKENQFDLAIVDVPYGINQGGDKNKTRGKLAVSKDYHSFNDTAAPDSEYFDLLKKKSTNQIIWGANHFLDNMPFNLNSSCWVVWDKVNGNTDFADCEIAWTSFKTAVRIFRFQWQGMIQGYGGNKKNNEKRIHPTQKPVQLYKWLLQNYAKEGDTILDTHGGSMSIAIACWDLGFDLTAFEIDKDYYNDACKRIENHIKQVQMYPPEETKEVYNQKTLF